MKSKTVPAPTLRHIAFIMDGNGRWAKKRFLPRKAGHRAGVAAMRKVVDACFDASIPYVTVYAFSTENRNRPADEVQGLFGLIKEYFSDFLADLMQKNVRVLALGELEYFPEDVRKTVENAIEQSAQNTKGTFCIALNYGGRDELLRAVNVAVERGEKVDNDSFAKLLYTADIPDPDAIVRTGGEKRLSNFLLYQSAYSELIFTDTLWPDFSPKELSKVLDEYGARERRYGKVK